MENSVCMGSTSQHPSLRKTLTPTRNQHTPKPPMGESSANQTQSDICSSDLHLKVFTLKYQTEVIQGTPHREARTNAQEFCASHFENDSFLQQWMSEALSRMSDAQKRKENETDPQKALALQISADRTISCLALGYMVEQWAEVGARLGHEEVVRLPMFEDVSLTRRFTCQEYCRRLGKHIRCSTSTFVVAAALLKRLSKKLGRPFVTPLTHRRVLLTSLLVAVKLCDDELGTNRFYARLGCVPVDELNRMERFVMQQLDFAVFVRDEEFEKNRRMLEGIIDLAKSELQSSQSQSLFKALAEFVERKLRL